jgi:hypothetical protein
MSAFGVVDLPHCIGVTCAGEISSKVLLAQQWYGRSLNERVTRWP